MDDPLLIKNVDMALAANTISARLHQHFQRVTDDTHLSLLVDSYSIAPQQLHNLLVAVLTGERKWSNALLKNVYTSKTQARQPIGWHGAHITKTIIATSSRMFTMWTNHTNPYD